MEVLAKEMDSEEIEAIQEEIQAEFLEANIDEQEVLKSARDDLVLWDGYFNENVVRGKSDMEFLLRDQWSAAERSEFTRLFKPAMTFNKLYDTTKKIVGEQRKNKPDLIVRSLTGKATQEQINLRADLVRTISYQSQNDLVYQTAFKSALYRGYGAFEILLDYETPRSFNQVVRFDLIPDATKTSFDPTATKPHKGDGNFCARQFIYSKDEFYATYPWVTNPVSYSDPRSLLDFQWQTKDTIIVNKYTRKEWFPLKIYFLSNGQVVTETEWEEMQEQYKVLREMAEQSMVVGKMINAEIPKIKAERQTRDYNIRQYMMTQNQIIKFSDWPSKHLPIIFTDGDSNYIEGKQYTRSFIHEAKDAQRFVNYVGSEITAEIKNRRREQWIGTPDNINGQEQMWRNPELQMGILLAKPDPKTGAMPQKMPPWDLSPALLAQFQRGCQDMREIMGFSENEELQGRDMSGKARRERKLEGSMSAYVWFDNLNQAIEQAGRVVLDLLPVVAGTEERHMVISKPDGRTESIILNQQTKDGIANIIEAGDYDVEIDTGPSFAVQKDVALEFFAQTISENPQVFPLIADLWASQLDLAQMPQIKERLKTLVPKDVLAKEEGKEPPPPQPNPQMMMMQMEMQAKQAEIQNKMQEIKLKAEKLELEREQNQLDQAKLMIDAQKAQQDAELNVFDHKINLAKTVATHRLDKQKAESDFTHKLTQTFADLHKHHTQLDHDKEIARQKPKTAKE
jgi:hypothetical protein